MIILGLDLSTSCCGVAYIQHPDKKILDAFFIDISKVDTTKEKIKLIIDVLDKHSIKFDSINLEASLSGFAGGFTSQQVIIKLSRFNAVTEYVLNEHYNITVNLIGAMTARKQLFGKCREKGMKPKNFVRQELSKIYDLEKYNKTTKTGLLDKRVADVYDAVVIGCFL